MNIDREDGMQFRVLEGFFQNRKSNVLWQRNNIIIITSAASPAPSSSFISCTSLRSRVASSSRSAWGREDMRMRVCMYYRTWACFYVWGETIPLINVITLRYYTWPGISDLERICNLCTFISWSQNAEGDT